MYNDNLNGTAYFIRTLIDDQLIGGRALRLCLWWLSQAKGYHVLAVRVLIVGDIGDVVERVAGKDSLFLVVHHLHTIFGQRDDTFVQFTGHPWQPTLALMCRKQTSTLSQ